MIVVFPASYDPTEVVQPSDGSFDGPSPSVSSELSTVLQRMPFSLSAVGTDQINAVRMKPFTQSVTIGSFIIDQALDLWFADDAFLKQRFNESDLVSIGAFNVDGQGNSLGVDKQHDLCSLAATCRADAFTPFFADANVPSAKHSDQSTRSLRSLRRSSRAQARSKMPASVHSLKRSQQVDLEGKHFGKSFHRAPVRSTQRMPSKQARGSALGRPPCTEGGFQGNKSLIRNHCSSVSCVKGSILDPAASDRNDRVRDRAVMVRTPFGVSVKATYMPTYEKIKVLGLLLVQAMPLYIES